MNTFVSGFVPTLIYQAYGAPAILENNALITETTNEFILTESDREILVK